LKALQSARLEGAERHLTLCFSPHSMTTAVSPEAALFKSFAARLACPLWYASCRLAALLCPLMRTPAARALTTCVPVHQPCAVQRPALLPWVRPHVLQARSAMFTPFKHQDGTHQPCSHDGARSGPLPLDGAVKQLALATACRQCVAESLEGPGVTASQCPTCARPGWLRELLPNRTLAALVACLAEAERAGAQVQAQHSVCSRTSMFAQRPQPGLLSQVQQAVSGCGEEQAKVRCMAAPAGPTKSCLLRRQLGGACGCSAARSRGRRKRQCGRA